MRVHNSMIVILLYLVQTTVLVRARKLKEQAHSRHDLYDKTKASQIFYCCHWYIGGWLVWKQRDRTPEKLPTKINVVCKILITTILSAIGMYKKGVREYCKVYQIASHSKMANGNTRNKFRGDDQASSSHKNTAVISSTSNTTAGTDTSNTRTTSTSTTTTTGHSETKRYMGNTSWDGIDLSDSGSSESSDDGDNNVNAKTKPPSCEIRPRWSTDLSLTSLLIEETNKTKHHDNKKTRKHKTQQNEHLKNSTKSNPPKK